MSIPNCRWFQETFSDRTVFVTGHTGFKGAWLCEWLLSLGARVVGFSLPPPTTPSLFEELKLWLRLSHQLGDIRDAGSVAESIGRAQPDFVFHLAAQSLVRVSYQEPIATYATNVLGTAHVLEAVRLAKRSMVVITIATDKCYENREWPYSYREEDRLGGRDPYSSSKAAAELVTAAYRDSFFQPSKSQAIAVASARAGNVVGGGDWALDRIVPDCMRALDRGEAISVRNPGATRPWQHVLEPLAGYLTLAATIAEAKKRGAQSELEALCSAFNFGPWLNSNCTVSDLVEQILKHRAGSWVDSSTSHAPHEASRLNLTIDKAFHLLRWKPVWDFERTIAETVRWYRDARKDGPADFTRSQIESYITSAADADLLWTR